MRQPECGDVDDQIEYQYGNLLTAIISARSASRRAAIMQAPVMAIA